MRMANWWAAGSSAICGVFVLLQAAHTLLRGHQWSGYVRGDGTGGGDGGGVRATIINHY